jgi:flagellar FliL protein
MRPGRIILLLVILLLLAGGAVAGLFFRAPLEQLIGLGAASPEPAAKKVIKPEDRAFCDLPDILVTLDNRNRSGNHTITLAVSLVLDDKDEQAQIQAHLPRVLDVFQVYVRQLKVEDVTGVPQIQHLRAELLTRLNTALAPLPVADILFREVLVQ